MSKLKPPVIAHFEPPHASLRAYTTGFALSIALTVCAFLLVSHHALAYWPLLAVIAALALAQFVAQLLCFLHLGREFKPRWKLLTFVLMLSIVLILVVGSIWIMANLNYRMLDSPTQVNQYLQSQDNL